MDPEDDPRTPFHRLLDNLVLESELPFETLHGLVHDRRSQGWAWDRVALAIATHTGERVSSPTLIDWFRDDEAIRSAYRRYVTAL